MATGTTVNLKLLIQATNRASKQVLALQGQLNEVSKAAQELATKSKKAGTQGAEAMGKFSRSTSGIRAKLDGIKEGLEGIGGAGLALIGIATTLATTAFFPIKSAADFEQSMSKVTAVTTGAVEKFEELKAVASELGRTTKFTAKEAADGMLFLGQAGFEASEVISGIGPSLKLAAAAGISLAESADIASNIISAMRLPIEGLSDATDILANTAASSNTNILQLADAMKYAAPLAAAAGISLEETSSIIGVLGNNGIQASMAGTAVRGMLRALAAPSKQASKVLKELNIEIKTNADGSLDLIGVLHQLAEANLTTAQANKVFGRFAAAGALAVTANIEVLDELIDSNYAAAGSASEMAKIMQDNVKGAFVLVTSALDGLKRAFGDPLLGVIKVFLQAMAKVVSTMTKVVEKFPVLVTIIGTLTGVVIIVTASLGLLALSLASVGATAGQLSKVLETQLIIRLGTLILSLKTTIVLLLATGTRALGMSRIMYALGASFRWVGIQLKALWVAMLAHPLIAVIAVIGLLLVALAEWSGRNKRLIAEAKQLAAEMYGTFKEFELFEKKIKDLTVGSKKYIAEMKNMRVKLLETAKSQKELNLEAIKAAHSIDEFSGKVLDGGKALEEFKEKTAEVALEAMNTQLEGLNDQLDILHGKSGFIDSFWDNFIMGLKLIRVLLPGFTLEELRKEVNEAREEAERAIESTRRHYIKMLTDMGKFSDDLPVEEAIAFFEIIEGKSRETAEELGKLHGVMQDEVSTTKEKIEELNDLSTEELRNEIQKTTTDLKALNAEFTAASAASAEAVNKWMGMTVEQRKNATALRGIVDEALKRRIKAAKDLADAEEIGNAKVKAFRESLAQDTKNASEVELKAIKRNLKLKNIAQFQADDQIAKLNLKTKNQRIENLAEVLDFVRESSLEETKEAKKTAKDFQKAMGEVGEASEKLRDTRIIHANEVAEAIRTINQEAAREELAMMADSRKKFIAEGEIEIQSLRAKAKAKGISLSSLAEAERVIRKKAADKGDAYNRMVSEKYYDWDLEKSQYAADLKLDKLQAAFEAGQISAEEYTEKSLKIQTDVIDKEIELLEDKLAAAIARMESADIVLDLNIEVEKAKQKKIKVVREGEAAGPKLALKAAQKELSIDQVLLQGKLNNLRVYKDGLQSMADQELAILKNKHAQELISMELANVDKAKIKERELQQLTEQGLKQEELDKKIIETKLGWASKSADTMVGIFGDMYALSGEKAKHWFYLEKAAAIARVTIDTQAAAMKAMAMMGPYAGQIQAALIYIQGAMSIARITSQNLASGGEVQGKSPHKRADNIPANLTAEEWVHPVDAVKYYGKKVMSGMQNMVFPKEMFRNYRLPRQKLAYARTGYASGGQAVNRENTSGQSKSDPIVAAPQPINIINVTDPGELDRYLTTSTGQNAVLNVLSSRSEMVKRILK